MRSRLVIWGTNAENEKVLLAISLNAEENKVEIHSIPEVDITEEYFNTMMSLWREGEDLNFPPSTVHRIMELTMAEGILPEDLKVERGDVIQRAQLEWHFLVLSSKLYKNYKNDLEDISDKIKRLEVYDQKLWDELKGLWDNIQKHIYEKNLLRDHGDALKSKTNALFEELKVLRKALNSEMEQKSKQITDQIIHQIQAIEEKISSGAVLKPQFDALKKIQDDFRSISVTRDHKDFVIKKMNEVFKIIREKREHRSNKPGTTESDSGDHITRRFEGLLQAIYRMDQSIARDKRDIVFENRRIETTSAQLEAQIRVAKIRMIEESIRSKQEKLDELLITKVKLEKITEKIKKREEKQLERVKETHRLKEEELRIKAKITDEIHHAKDTVSEEENERLIKAADDIKKSNTRRKEKEPEIKSADEVKEENPEEIQDIQITNEAEREMAIEPKRKEKGTKIADEVKEENPEEIQGDQKVNAVEGEMAIKPKPKRKAKKMADEAKEEKPKEIQGDQMVDAAEDKIPSELKLGEEE